MPLTELVSDPESPGGDDSGITFGPTVLPADTSARVEWNTTSKAISQVYYRRVGSPSTPVSPTGTLLFTTYLPLIGRGPNLWSWTALDPTPKTGHVGIISGLMPDRTYEYFVVSRGVSGGACVNWVSDRKEFTTLTTQ
jgi:hypothetical protein